jgi:DHA2 family multidrug resistance protein
MQATAAAPVEVVASRPSWRAWVAVGAVLFGAFISTLTGRLSSFGLADIRGALHAGFDEGAWITTAQTVGQMLVTPVAVWAGGAYGAKRVLTWGAALFTLVSGLLPFCTSIEPFLALQFLSGIGSGTFIPLTLGVVLRSLPQRMWAYGIAVYGLNLELSLNISASLEAWYVDNWDWRFIFWQNVPLGIAMLACLHVGFGAQVAPKRWSWPKPFGVLTVGLGLALVYAGLDQGNRLDWLGSGLVAGLLLAGAILLAGALLLGLLHPSAWFDLAAAVRWPMPLLLLNICVLRLTILSTAYLIPQFLVTVRGFRTFEVGQALLWIAGPQLITAPIVAVLLLRLQSRWIACAGLVAIAGACFIVAHGMTPQWGPEQFLPTQLLQALGQSLALSGIVYTGLHYMKPDAAPTFGAMLQVARLLGGEAGLAFVVTFVRQREQHASDTIGQHVAVGDAAVSHRLSEYGSLLAGHDPSGTTEARSLALLARSVRQAADTQSVIDGFLVIGLIAFLALVLMIVLGTAPSAAEPAGTVSHEK